MHCKNCGTGLLPEDDFCTHCGSRQHQQTKNFLPSENEKNKWKKIGFGIAAVVLCVVLFCVYKYCTSYKRTVSRFLKAIEERDAELYGGLLATGWKELMADDWGYDEKDFLDDFEDVVDDYYYEYVADCGDDISSSYTITDTYEPTAKELKQLINELEDDYDYEEGSVTDAMLVSFEWDIEGDEGECEVTFTDMLLIKEYGKWKKVRGWITTDWCNQ